MSNSHKIHVEFPGRIVFVGFGSIGQGVLPLILRHIGIPPERITIVTAEDKGERGGRASTASNSSRNALTRENYRRGARPAARARRFPAQCLGRCLEHRADRAVLGEGRDVSRHLHRALARAATPTRPCRRPSAPTTRCARRRSRCGSAMQRAPTAVLTHGANPGLVSHFVKQALLNIAADLQVDAGNPGSRAEWAALARKRLGIKVDPHRRARHAGLRASPKEPGEFVNTWSIDGFVGEGCQPAELGWGTHERNFPRDGKRHDFGCMAAIYLTQPGRRDARAHLDAAGRAASWLSDHPQRGDLDRRLLHGARGRAGRSTARPCTTPTTRATTRCCRCTSSPAATTCMQERQRIMMDEITGGIDELGRAAGGPQEERLLVRLAAVDRGGAQARALQQRHQPAGDARRCWPAWSGRWRTRNVGIIEPDEMDFRRALEICTPYLGPVVGEYTDWTPLTRSRAAVPRGPRQDRPLAVQERAGHLVGAPSPGASSYSIATITKARLPPGDLERDLIVEPPAEQCPPERRVHADVAVGHVELVGSDDAVARANAVGCLERHPGAEEHAPRGPRAAVPRPPCPPGVGAETARAGRSRAAAACRRCIRRSRSGRPGLRPPARPASPAAAPRATAARAPAAGAPQPGRVMYFEPTGSRAPEAPHSGRSCELCRTHLYRKRPFCGTSHGLPRGRATNLKAWLPSTTRTS